LSEQETARSMVEYIALGSLAHRECAESQNRILYHLCLSPAQGLQAFTERWLHQLYPGHRKLSSGCNGYSFAQSVVLHRYGRNYNQPRSREATTAQRGKRDLQSLASFHMGRVFRNQEPLCSETREACSHPWIDICTLTDLVLCYCSTLN
jgi:hypothetical protein